MPLCTSCDAVTVQSLTAGFEDVPAWWHEVVGRDSHRRGLKHLPDARRLPTSSTSCDFCALLTLAIIQSNEGRKFPRNVVNPQEQWDGSSFGQYLTGNAIYLVPKRESQPRSFPQTAIKNAWYLTGIMVLVPVEGDVLTGVVRLFAVPGTPAALSGDILGRPPLRSLGSQDAQDLVSRWLGTCVTSHQACRQTLSGETIDDDIEARLPTRIIDVGAADGLSDPRLVETEGARGHYVTLSHCWGSQAKHPLTTTRTNLQTFRRGIAWNSLPKTFKDAITVTRGIGMRYIWIDSLCIVQDDLDDWRRESQNMADVYGNARLTIAASHALDSSFGCFLNRSTQPPAVDLPAFSNNAFGIGSVFATTPVKDYDAVSPERGPLCKRAWATQEWLLSRRMVFYTKDCLIWSCKVLTQRETGEKCHNTARNTKWKNIVEHYSARSLSKDTDRLIALDGLRNALQGRIHGRYVMGLWENALPDQLLWRVRGKGGSRLNPLNMASWSWASTPHAVRYIEMTRAKSMAREIRLLDTGVLSIEGRMKVMHSVTEWACVSPEMPIITSKNEVTGSSSNTILEKVRSELRDISITDEKSDSRGTATANDPFMLSDRNKELLGWAFLDEPDIRNDLPAYCLLLMSNLARSDRRWEHMTEDSKARRLHEDWVLLLQPRATSQAEYVRVGVGKTFRRAWWIDAPVQRVLVG